MSKMPLPVTLSRRAFGAGVVAGSLGLGLGVLANVKGARGAPVGAGLFAALSRGGHVGLMRHALAPGFSDPDGFRLDDCSIQRNLSEEGRQQAREAGVFLRASGLDRARVYSSQWCRCLETARLLAFGEITPLPALNSFFEDRGRGPAQIVELRDWLGAQPLDVPVLLVTHQVVITALAGVTPRSGEVVVLRRETDSTLTTLGRAMPQEPA